MTREAPVLGLALGSGSARGWAHIGVIRALADLGIESTVVSGCSVGAMVGAAWAARRLTPFESWTRSLTRRDVFGFLDVSFGSGLVKGERLFSLFERWSDLQIEELPHPFAAVATDLESGERLEFTEGRLIDAVRASMAMPGLFPPVRLDGRWLVDGALVDPIPVELCRRLGAERVIAVNLNHGIVEAKSSRRLAKNPPPEENDPAVSSGLVERPEASEAEIEQHAESSAQTELEAQSALTRTLDQMSSHFGDRLEELKKWLAPQEEEASAEAPGLYDVMVGALHILQDRVTQVMLAQDPPDLELRPDLGDIGLLEVYRAEEAIAEGRRVVEEAADQIRELLTSDSGRRKIK